MHRSARTRPSSKTHSSRVLPLYELTVNGLHVSAGPGFAVHQGDDGRVLVNRVVVGADSVRSLELTALLFFLPSSGNADRVFADWQRRCNARSRPRSNARWTYRHGKLIRPTRTTNAGNADGASRRALRTLSGASERPLRETQRIPRRREAPSAASAFVVSL